MSASEVTKDCKAELRHKFAGESKDKLHSQDRRLTKTAIDAGDHFANVRSDEWFKATVPGILGDSHIILAQNVAANRMSLDRIEAKGDALMEYLVKCVTKMTRTIRLWVLTMAYSTCPESSD